MSRPTGAVTVRGNPSPEEMAVVLAMVSRPSVPADGAEPDYERWRRRRLAAVRPKQER